MKGKIKKATSLLVAAVFALPLASCTQGGTTIDATKSQLYVYCINSGYKIEWFESAVADYERINADKSFEEGKVGVQIVPYTIKSSLDATGVLNDETNEVFIFEHVAYRSWFNSGVFADITDAITQPNPYEPEGSKYPTVQSRFNSQIDEGLNIDGHYYAVPHFYGNYGLVYNADLFDKYDWYFNTDGDIIGAQGVTNTTKGTGPNGILGDYDDGLPRTYDEFFELCDLIAEYQAIPVRWTGAYMNSHLEGLLDCLITDYEGYENAANRFDFTGVQDLLKVDEDGNITITDGVPEIEKNVSITVDNGYEVFRQAGIYYGLDFIRTLIQTPKYHNDDNQAFGNYTQVDAQDDFIYAGLDGVTPETAILVDGDWWLQEADDTFKDTQNDYGSKYERNFKWMPLPKATLEKVGENACDYDDTNGMCFVSSNIDDEKLPLAIDFVQFLNSGEQLVKYTQITNTLRPLNYDMTEEELSEMTPFGRSLYEHKKSEKSDWLYTVSNSAAFVLNQSFIEYPYFSRCGDSTAAKSRPADAFHNNLKLTTEQYFSGENGMYGHCKGKYANPNQ